MTFLMSNKQLNESLEGYTYYLAKCDMQAKLSESQINGFKQSLTLILAVRYINPWYYVSMEGTCNGYSRFEFSHRSVHIITIKRILVIIQMGLACELAAEHLIFEKIEQKDIFFLSKPKNTPPVKIKGKYGGF